MILWIEIILVASALLVLFGAAGYAGKKAAEYKVTRQEFERRLEPKRLALQAQSEIIQKRALLVSLQSAHLQERQAVLQKTLLKAAVLLEALQGARSDLKQLPRRFGF